MPPPETTATNTDLRRLRGYSVHSGAIGIVRERVLEHEAHVLRKVRDRLECPAVEVILDGPQINRLLDDIEVVLAAVLLRVHRLQEYAVRGSPHHAIQERAHALHVGSRLERQTLARGARSLLRGGGSLGNALGQLRQQLPAQLLQSAAGRSKGYRRFKDQANVRSDLFRRGICSELKRRLDDTAVE